MTDMQDIGTCRSAVEELEDSVRVFLRLWEDSSDLPSEAAHKLVGMILRYGRLDEARREIIKIKGPS